MTACGSGWSEARGVSPDPYSRLILILKIGLPLLALGILSTLFLLSSRIEPAGEIPFPEDEVTERLRSQRVSDPVYSGVTDAGDRLSFEARSLMTENDRNLASAVFATLDFLGGGAVTLEAARGELTFDADKVDLSENVRIASTQGYLLTSDFMTATLSEGHLVSPGPVSGTGRGTLLTAGRMEIRTNPETGAAEMLFTDGVQLVYEPERTE